MESRLLLASDTTLLTQSSEAKQPTLDAAAWLSLQEGLQPLVGQIEGQSTESTDGVFSALADSVGGTTVAKYFDNRDAAMALNYDTELYLCGMIHSFNGYDPEAAAIRAQKTRVGWPNIMDDSETYGIPVSFNICGPEAVFGDRGAAEYTSIDITHAWHPDPHWATNTWYSDAPPQGGNYKTVGELGGETRSYELIYGGDLTERAFNSHVPFEISYHNFGHESVRDIDAETMDETFRLGVEYHKRIGSKFTAQAPPWNLNPQSEKLPIYQKYGIFTFNRRENATSEPYEVIEDLWVIPRHAGFNVTTDLTGEIDAVLENGHVLAPYSHPEDGFERTNREAFQNNLAYARTKVDSGDLWATTLSEIGRYWEAKSDASVTTEVIDGKTIVDISLADYDASTFGIPYLTFVSPMPDDSSHVQIAVDYPTPQTLNSTSPTVRVDGDMVTYTIYLNPSGPTRVAIDGVDREFVNGVDLNRPVLSIESDPPKAPAEGTPITIQATSQSTDTIYAANLIYQRNDEAKVSFEMIEMIDNEGVWEATIDPLLAGDDVTYYVSVTDNSGRRERSENKQFSVIAELDLEPPSWRFPGQSEDQPPVGSPVALYAEARDRIGLQSAKLETDETGTWQEHPEYGSPLDLDGIADKWALSSFLWDNPSIPVGTTVAWRIRFVDVAGNESVTDASSFLVSPPGVDLEPPQFADPDVDLVRLGEPVTFSLEWSENEGLAGYVFSFDDGNGTFVDDPFTPFTQQVGDWWDENWKHRRTITIDNTSNAEPLTEHAVLITVDTAGLVATGRMNRNGGDLRFLDGDQELDFWVESGMNSASTRIWVQTPAVAAGATKQIAMYYGNSRRTVPRSAGDETFSMFDDFGGRGWEEFKYSGNPIKGPGSPAGQGTFSSVLRESDGTWKMYSSFDQDGLDISLSTSSDGIQWERVGVVLRKGSEGEWDSLNHWAPVVWKEEGTYYMLHPARGPLGTQMGLATSPDGINWTKYDDPVTTEAPFAESDPVFNDSVWADEDTESPCFSLLHEEGIYYVMYNTLGSPRRSSVATSTDLIQWTPVSEEPRFPGGANTLSWNFNTFCGHAFPYEDEFYLLLPGQDGSKNHGKFGLYVSSSPAFPEEDTEFKGIVMVGDPHGWESEDMDTPWIVMLEDRVHMYYAACGTCFTETGVAIIPDLGLALAQAYPPGNYIEVDRTATASQQIRPPVGWAKSIGGFLERDAQDFRVTLEPAVSGRAVIQMDGNSARPLEMSKTFEAMQRGVVSAWMRTDSRGTGDYDMYVYGDSQETLGIVAGLGGEGTFHYWNGDFVDTGVSYEVDAWYRIELEFDVAVNTYNFVVYDDSFVELVRVNDINFGREILSGIDRVNLRTSVSYQGNAIVDDVVVRRRAGSAPEVVVGEESSFAVTAATASTTKEVPFNLGANIRWKYTAEDMAGNRRESDVFDLSFRPVPLLDTPPFLSVGDPQDEVVASAPTVEFHASCSDERDISEVSLWGSWSPSQPVQTLQGPGINDVEVVFTAPVPQGSWQWHVECTDSTSNSVASPERTIQVESVQAAAAIGEAGFQPVQGLAVDQQFPWDLSDPSTDWSAVWQALQMIAHQAERDRERVDQVFAGDEVHLLPELELASGQSSPESQASKHDEAIDAR